MALIAVLCLWLCGAAVRACSRQHISDLVVTHFDTRTIPRCQGVGQQCKYNRNCCPGMECKMGFDGTTIVTACRYRKVHEDYQEMTAGPSWKDYQELESSEENKLRGVNLQVLEVKNAHLRKKIDELKWLRVAVRRQQLMDLKWNMEQQEIEELKEEKRKYDEKKDRELKLLLQRESYNQLISLERKEVNHTMSTHKRVADIFLDMLDNLANN